MTSRMNPELRYMHIGLPKELGEKMDRHKFAFGQDHVFLIRRLLSEYFDKQDDLLGKKKK